MTNSETKNFSQNVSSSYHLEDRGKNTCAQIRNVPKLRFKGYNDEWKEYRLKDIVTRITRKNKKLESDRPLTISAIDGLIDQKDYFNRQIASKDISGYYLLKNGEFAYNKSYSNGYPYGSIKRLNKYDKGALSTLYICFSLRSFCSDFLEKYFETDKWYKEIYMIAVEGARNHGLLNISVDDFFNTMHKFPSLPEQEKIASFLTLIDKKIEKQKEIVKLLKKYKRGLLSKIFSQKIRFKDNNGNYYPAWEEKTLGQVTDNISYGLNSASKKYDGENKYIRITDIDETTGKYNHLDIVSPDCDLSDEYKLKINDLLFARTGASTGKTYLYNENDGKIYFAGFLIKFSIKEEYCSTFIFYITQTFNYKKWVSIMSARSGQPGINAKEYSKYKFLCPVYDEQIKISNIISKLDNIIEKENILLNFYNDYKKGILQQMFI